MMVLILSESGSQIVSLVLTCPVSAFQVFCVSLSALK